MATCTRRVRHDMFLLIVHNLLAVVHKSVRHWRAARTGSPPRATPPTILHLPDGRKIEGQPLSTRPNDVNADQAKQL
eukprot:15463149-Alexandrium_andersonii.AAC.1